MEEILLEEVGYISTKYLNALKKCNINTVEDLLMNFPNKFDDYTVTSMQDALPDTTITVAGVVQTKATVMNTKTNLSIMTFFVDVDGRKVKATIFNRHYLKSKISYGVFVKLTGKFKEDMKNFIASEIHFDEFGNDINPVFNIKGISDEKMLELKEKIYRDYKHIIEETIPSEIRNKLNLISLKDAIKYINIPCVVRVDWNFRTNK